MKFDEMVHEDFGINRLGNELELSYALLESMLSWTPFVFSSMMLNMNLVNEERKEYVFG